MDVQYDTESYYVVKRFRLGDIDRFHRYGAIFIDEIAGFNSRGFPVWFRPGDEVREVTARDVPRLARLPVIDRILYAMDRGLAVLEGQGGTFFAADVHYLYCCTSRHIRYVESRPGQQPPGPLERP
jgi:hypothetical protein